MAGVKITDLTPLATAASDDLLYIVDVSDTTSGPQGTSKAIEVSDLRGYKVYSALLTQPESAIVPSVNILENTIGNVTWIYDTDGLSHCELPIGNTTNTYCIATNNDTAQNYPSVFFRIGSYVNGEVSILNLDENASQVNGFYQAIEIRVYN